MIVFLLGEVSVCDNGESTCLERETTVECLHSIPCLNKVCVCVTMSRGGILHL